MTYARDYTTPHYVLVGSNKRAIQSEWPDVQPSPQEVREHLANKGKIGLIPASLGCTAIDIDLDDEKLAHLLETCLIAELGQPLARVPSQTHPHVHLLYPGLLPYGTNKTNFYFGDAHAGELICDRSYIILHDTEAWFAAIKGFIDDEHVPVDFSMLLAGGHPDSEGKWKPDLAPGNRNTSVYWLAATCDGTPEALKQILTDATAAGLPEKEAIAAITSGINSEKQKAVQQARAIVKERAPEPVEQFEAPLEKNVTGFKIALDLLGIQCRYNIRLKRVEYLGLPDTTTWTPASDMAESWIQSQIQLKFVCQEGKKLVPLLFGSVTWTRVLNTLTFQQQFDPFREYLESQPNWDGTSRIEVMLNALFDIPQEQSGLAAWGGAFIFRAAVQRCYHPGAKLDEMPVLCGPQRAGKSTLIRMALPDLEGEEWFGDALNLGLKDKERVEALQGKVIVEASELSGLTKAEVTSLKAFLSRTNDNAVRLAYRQNPEHDAPRRCAIVGTTNDADCLPPDPTGNRRFVVIEVKPRVSVAEIRKFMDDNRPQLWAEALHWWRTTDNPSARLPDELMHVQESVNAEHVNQNEALEVMVASAVAELERDSKPVTVAEICETAKIDVRYSRVITGILQAMDYAPARKRIGGAKVRCWSPKSSLLT